MSIEQSAERSTRFLNGAILLVAFLTQWPILVCLVLVFSLIGAVKPGYDPFTVLFLGLGKKRQANCHMLSCDQVSFTNYFVSGALLISLALLQLSHTMAGWIAVLIVSVSSFLAAAGFCMAGIFYAFYRAAKSRLATHITSL